MTDDAALLTAVLAHPEEDTPRLALADWFDEHDEPKLAAALRTGSRLTAFLAELIRWDCVPSLPMRAYESTTARDLFPILPAAQLLTRYRDLFPTPPEAPTEFDPHAVAPRTATDPLDPVSFLYRWQYARQRQMGQLREQAARRAASRAYRTFGPGPATPEAFEGRCCLLQELVIRGRVVADITGVKKHAAVMQKQHHPLAWLPLELRSAEAGIGAYLPHFSRSGHSVGSGSVPGTPVPARSRNPGPRVDSSTYPAEDSEAWAAVRHWQTQSNGSLEACEFRFERPVIADGVGVNWFGLLPADSVSSAPRRRLSLSRIPFSRALLDLFSAAQSGGAYGGSQWGAYGRLYAWQSVQWLTGANPDADVPTIETLAELCRWFSFGGTDWFNNIAWDLGLIAIRPDGMSAALLAATDTD